MKNENNTTAVKKARPKWLYILMAVAVVLVIDVILFAALKNRSSESDEPEGSVQSGAVSESAAEGAASEAVQNEIQGAEAAEETKDISIQLDRGLEITKIGSYTGAYVEDGTDEVVSGVLMLVVSNNGDEYIQYGEINVNSGESAASFSLSTLMPGETAVLLEQNRMEYVEGAEYTAEAVNVAVFDEVPRLYEDMLEIQQLDGALNITNISGQDISGDVVIYYKNYVSGMYYGGITYRVRIEGGMADGEIRQIMTEHFSASGSKIVFVTVG